MDGLVIIASAVAVIFCALPGVMAWHFYAGGKQKRSTEARRVIRHTQPAKV